MKASTGSSPRIKVKSPKSGSERLELVLDTIESWEQPPTGVYDDRNPRHVDGNFDDNPDGYDDDCAPRDDVNGMDFLEQQYYYDNDILPCPSSHSASTTETDNRSSADRMNRTWSLDSDGVENMVVPSGCEGDVGVVNSGDEGLNTAYGDGGDEYIQRSVDESVGALTEEDAGDFGAYYAELSESVTALDEEDSVTATMNDSNHSNESSNDLSQTQQQELKRKSVSFDEDFLESSDRGEAQDTLPEMSSHDQTKQLRRKPSDDTSVSSVGWKVKTKMKGKDETVDLAPVSTDVEARSSSTNDDANASADAHLSPAQKGAISPSILREPKYSSVSSVGSNGIKSRASQVSTASVAGSGTSRTSDANGGRQQDTRSQSSVVSVAGSSRAQSSRGGEECASSTVSNASIGRSSNSMQQHYQSQQPDYSHPQQHQMPSQQQHWNQPPTLQPPRAYWDGDSLPAIARSPSGLSGYSEACRSTAALDGYVTDGAPKRGRGRLISFVPKGLRSDRSKSPMNGMNVKGPKGVMKKLFRRMSGVHLVDDTENDQRVGNQASYPLQPRQQTEYRSGQKPTFDAAGNQTYNKRQYQPPRDNTMRRTKKTGIKKIFQRMNISSDNTDGYHPQEYSDEEDSRIGKMISPRHHNGARQARACDNETTTSSFTAARRQAGQYLNTERDRHTVQQQRRQVPANPLPDHNPWASIPSNAQHPAVSNIVAPTPNNVADNILPNPTDSNNDNIPDGSYNLQGAGMPAIKWWSWSQPDPEDAQKDCRYCALMCMFPPEE